MTFTPARSHRPTGVALLAAVAVAFVGLAAASPAAAATAATTTTTTGAATAATAPALTVGGVALASSTQPDGTFTVAIAAPKGVRVKFKIDGEYLGQDKTSPFSWPISAGSGEHEIKARWDGGDAEAEFVVENGAPPVAPPEEPPVESPPATGGSTVGVSTAKQLKAALESARPGQTIALAAGRYVGKFEAAASGTLADPITLTGPRTAILTTGAIGSGYGLHITGDNWRITGLSVNTASKGIVLDGSTHTVISGVDVGSIGAEAVHFRSGSSDGVIEDSVIHDTGLDQPNYGEAVYVGSAKSNWGKLSGGSADRSDRVIVRNNRITNTSAEGIDVKEGTTGGSITGNSFTNAGYSGENSADSWIDIKGNGYTVKGNRGTGTLLDAIQVHDVLDGWGRGNTISGTTVLGGVPGYEVWIQSASLGNTVACKSSGADKGLTNVDCG